MGHDRDDQREIRGKQKFPIREHEGSLIREIDFDEEEEDREMVIKGIKWDSTIAGYLWGPPPPVTGWVAPDQREITTSKRLFDGDTHERLRIATEPTTNSGDD